MTEKNFEGGCFPMNAFTDRPLAKVHKFYLSGEIKAPSEYISWFEVIRNSSENDVISIHINSYGGDLFTAIQFMRVKRLEPGLLSRISNCLKGLVGKK